MVKRSMAKRSMRQKPLKAMAMRGRPKGSKTSKSAGSEPPAPKAMKRKPAENPGSESKVITYLPKAKLSPTAKGSSPRRSSKAMKSTSSEEAFSAPSTRPIPIYDASGADNVGTWVGYSSGAVWPANA